MRRAARYSVALEWPMSEVWETPQGELEALAEAHAKKNKTRHTRGLTDMERRLSDHQLAKRPRLADKLSGA